MQWPDPSHMVPPLSVHAVPIAALVVPHMLLVQVSTLHRVVCAGQSDATLHWTHPLVALQTGVLPEQTVVAPWLHVPPPHVLPAMYELPLQLAAPHAVPAAGSWQTPATPHLPSATQPPPVHCPAGAAAPGRTSEHWPRPPDVCGDPSHA